MNPISIVITCYNKRPYLAEAVTSALQNDPQEIVIVDDGSLDGSLMEAERLARLDGRIRIIAQKNLGAAAARNAGWRSSQAPWIVFLDGDDRLTPTFAVRTLGAARQSGASIVSGFAQMFGARNDLWQPQQWDPYFIRYDNSIPICSLVSRDLIKAVDGFNVALPFAEDWDLWIRCGASCPTVMQLSEVLYEYRRTDSNNLSGFVDDKWELSAPLMMLANQGLYNVEDLKWAVLKFRDGAHVWLAPLQKHAARHPDNALLALIFGLIAEGQGDSNGAINHYVRVLGKAPNDVIALWRLGSLFAALGKHAESYQILHQARVVRPDMHFLVGTVLKESEAKACNSRQ